MFNHLNIEPPKLETAHEDNKHFYLFDGKKYPSITTILHSFPNPGIDIWKSKTPNWQDIQNESFEVGTDLHLLCETYLKNGKGNKEKYNPSSINLFIKLLPELDRINNIRCLETPIYEPNMGVAGTVDCIAEYEGIPCVIDFKNSRKNKDRYIKKSGYFEQVTFYSKAWEYCTSEKIEHGLILIANWDGTISKHLIKTHDYLDSLYDVLYRYEGLK